MPLGALKENRIAGSPDRSLTVGRRRWATQGGKSYPVSALRLEEWLD